MKKVTMYQDVGGNHHTTEESCLFSDACYRVQQALDEVVCGDRVCVDDLIEEMEKSPELVESFAILVEKAKKTK